MKSLFLFLALTCSAFGQVVLVGGCTATAATSCTPATVGGHSFAANQFIYTFAFRSATTAPTLASGFTTIGNSSASSSSFRSGCAMSTNSSPSSGTWTNATRVVTLIYDGVPAVSNANCLTVVGVHNNNSGTTSTITYGAVSISEPNGGSWIASGAGSSATTCTPSTVWTAEETATGISGLDSNGSVSSYTAKTCTATTGNWKSEVIEVRAGGCSQRTYGNFTCYQGQPVFSTASCPGTFTAGITPHFSSNDLLIAFSDSDSSAQTLALSDPTNGSWTRAQFSPIWNGAGLNYSGLFYVANTSTSALTITITCPTGAEIAIIELHSNVGTPSVDCVSGVFTTGIPLTLSAAAAASGGNTVYTGTITNGASSGLSGIQYTVSGFVNAANNGTFTVTASSSTTLTLNNAAGVVESAAATAGSPKASNPSTSCTASHSGDVGISWSDWNNGAHAGTGYTVVYENLERILEVQLFASSGSHPGAWLMGSDDVATGTIMISDGSGGATRTPTLLYLGVGNAP